MTPTTPIAGTVSPDFATPWRRLARGRSVVHSDPDWDALAGAGWVARIMSEEVTDRAHAKQGRSIGRWTLTRGGRTLVVYLKRHYVLPRRLGLLAALFPSQPWSPGLEEWRNLAWAQANGIPVPRTAAVGELRGPWGRLQSFLATEELTDMLPLHEAIPRARDRMPAEAFVTWKRGLLAELARLSREFHRRGAFHQDLYLCHFYVADADIGRSPTEWAGRVVVIDFHRLAHRKIWAWWWQAKDLGQLLYSTFDVPGVTDDDRRRFWALYRGGDWSGSSPPPEWVARVARRRARRYEQHNAKVRARIAG
ncbi:lipopolysaccharide kinase InaA family protein [Fimbriiglobus ruber]|uniref:Lipopolysaccharide core biosynthesis protein WaaP n=1 Tax=Fimbriiglobus ruber TaxID=1908690 RepID=A0A225DX78_9BACT|nr:lipopolysaccharide kinase InaA family protein [Fimbriiglobus ruber]OWK43098.1 Lipopolysaccharide core biosynthesis protein WaaP [Fimbriiglobus ruber]